VLSEGRVSRLLLPTPPPAPQSAAPTRPCPLCGARHNPPDGDAHAVPRPVTCTRCGLVFVDPVPAEATDAATYGAGYYEPWQRDEERPRRRMWRRRLRALDARAGRRGALLDVGCGDGLFLRVARDAGWRIDGIEFSPEGAARAAARLGRPVAIGDLAAAAVLPGPFDVVTVWHVLEHLPEPRPMLAAAHRRLRSGGLLVVAVPNLDNIPMRAAYRVARGRPLPLFEPGAREPHLSHFDRHTLRRILAEAGFAAIEVTTDRCALTPPKTIIDAAAALLGRLSGRLLTDAITAFARRVP
jgi:2-polyprenyl-3-methyl-5-hydroxy-6-metoxy-1,4-benzoquinol methylase